MSRWLDEVVKRAVNALQDKGSAERAAGAFAYMKGVAPFLGVATPDRRRLLKAAWSGLPSPTSDELGEAALALTRLAEREYHYAAYDLIARYVQFADADFLRKYVQPLLLQTPWWDTVDGLGNAAVSPLCRKFDSAGLIDEWSSSGNIWLIRAAIQHQRGARSETDVPRVLALCDVHWANREFFVAKAIGWALRDLTAIQREAVVDFLAAHAATRNAVAEREARTGLNRTS